MKTPTNSLISILNAVIDERHRLGSAKLKIKRKHTIRANTTLGELVSRKHDCDDLDFHLALVCFEITHRVSIPSEFSDNESLTIEELAFIACKQVKEDDLLFATRQIAAFAYATWSVITESADQELDKASRLAKKYRRN